MFAVIYPAVIIFKTHLYFFKIITFKNTSERFDYKDVFTFIIYVTMKGIQYF